MTRSESDAAPARVRASLLVPGVAIAGAFATLAWLAPRPGDPVCMAAISLAAAAYIWTAVRLSANPTLSPWALVIGLALAAGARVPMLTLPEAPAHDAVRYLWDARAVRAGLSPYAARPDDPALEHLHSDATRSVDAGWLPTIYPPVAQLYFLAVTAVQESIAGFRVAAFIAHGAMIVALLGVLRAAGRPAGWVLLYAWHPLLPLEGASGAHLDLAGVLVLVLSWLALLRGRTALAAIAFAGSVLIPGCSSSSTRTSARTRKTCSAW